MKFFEKIRWLCVREQSSCILLYVCFWGCEPDFIFFIHFFLSFPSICANFEFFIFIYDRAISDISILHYFKFVNCQSVTGEFNQTLKKKLQLKKNKHIFTKTVFYELVQLQQVFFYDKRCFISIKNCDSI